MTRQPYYLRFLVILSALYMCVHAAQLCAATNASGDVTPADPSQWDSSTTVRIGQTSNGTVTIDSNSDVLSRFAYIGYSSGYTGEFTVDGAGSTWTNSSRIYAGYSGNGVLNITGGGAVINDFGCLGYIADSVGTVKVDGKDSK
ncbi:MAG: hypothetical protein ABSG67_06995 [Thermoguttaceae bacterium]|jgi:T5SS/PEP-CTERM-associated repeat protein